jgi:hypothetical protein
LKIELEHHSTALVLCLQVNNFGPGLESQNLRQKDIVADIQAMDQVFLQADVNRIRLTCSGAYQRPPNQRPKSTSDLKRSDRHWEAYQKTAFNIE